MCVSANPSPLAPGRFEFPKEPSRSRPASVPPNWSPPDSPLMLTSVRHIVEARRRFEYFMKHPEENALSFSRLKISTLPKGFFTASEIIERLRFLDLTDTAITQLPRKLPPNLTVKLVDVTVQKDEQFTFTPPERV